MSLSADIFRASKAIGEVKTVRVVILRRAGVRGFDGTVSDPTRDVHNVQAVIGPRVERRDRMEEGTRLAGDRTYYLEKTFTLDAVDVAKQRVWLENRYIAQSIMEWEAVYEVIAVLADVIPPGLE